MYIILYFYLRLAVNLVIPRGRTYPSFSESTPEESTICLNPRKLCFMLCNTSEFLPEGPFIQNLPIPILIRVAEIEEHSQRIVRF